MGSGETRMCIFDPYPNLARLKTAFPSPKPTNLGLPKKKPELTAELGWVVQPGTGWLSKDISEVSLVSRWQTTSVTFEKPTPLVIFSKRTCLCRNYTLVKETGVILTHTSY